MILKYSTSQAETEQWPGKWWCLWFPAGCCGCLVGGRPGSTISIYYNRRLYKQQRDISKLYTKLTFLYFTSFTVKHKPIEGKKQTSTPSTPTHRVKSTFVGPSWTSSFRQKDKWRIRFLSSMVKTPCGAAARHTQSTELWSEDVSSSWAAQVRGGAMRSQEARGEREKAALPQTSQFWRQRSVSAAPRWCGCLLVFLFTACRRSRDLRPGLHFSTRGRARSHVLAGLRRPLAAVTEAHLPYRQEGVDPVRTRHHEAKDLVQTPNRKKRLNVRQDTNGCKYQDVSLQTWGPMALQVPPPVIGCQFNSTLDFKSLLIAFKAPPSLADSYITLQHLLVVFKSRLVTKGDWAFAIRTQRLWTSLPDGIRLTSTLPVFKLLFTLFYCNVSF